MKIIVKDLNTTAELIAEEVGNILSDKPDAVFGFSFGQDLIPVYNKLREMGMSGKLSFSKATAFVCCEYHELDKNDKGSIHSFMQDNLFDKSGFSEDRIFYPCTCTEDEEVLKEYDKQIKAAGGIDLFILGIGINGSIGFNEPATPFESFTHAQLLTDKTRNLVADSFNGSENVPEKGVTMGIKTIVASKSIALVAAGTEKKDIIHKVVYGKTVTFVPASMLQIHMNLVLYVDDDAAADI